MTRWLLIMSSDLTLVHCRGWALDGLASSSDELLSDDEHSSTSVFQLTGSVVCFIVVAGVTILVLVKVLIDSAKETLLLATVEVKRIPVADKRILVAEDGFPSPARVQLATTKDDHYESVTIIKVPKSMQENNERGQRQQVTAQMFASKYRSKREV